MIGAWVATGVGLGLIAGSFIATLIVRWPQQRGLGGRSACDVCGERLRWFELVPLLSFLASRGRCRRCGAPIDQMHVAVEMACAVAAGLALGVAPGIEGIFAAVTGWLLIALAILDLRHFWLPDVLTGLLAIVAVGGAFAGIEPPPVDRLIGGAAGFAVLWTIAAAYRRFRHREGLGGGDPKLFGAIGLWLGWQALPFVLLGASGLGIAAVLVMAARGKAVSGRTRVPFGALLAVAAFVVWVSNR